MHAYVIFYTLVTRSCPFDIDVKCNDTGRCYSSGSICDGYSHCRYGNDEENCGNETFKFICIICDWTCLNRAYLQVYFFHFFKFTLLNFLMYSCYLNEFIMIYICIN